jgi:endonuclease/exonuclease/phosphatase (EEP) superfamily protein YafD
MHTHLPPNPAEPTRRSARRRPTLIALGALGLLLPWWVRGVPASFERTRWLLDLAAHWQWLFAAALLLGALTLARKHPRALWALVLLPLPWWSATPTLPQASDSAAPSFTLASANVHVGTTQVAALAQWLAGAQPDAVVVLEVSPTLARELGSLHDYPHQVVHPDESPFGMALLSRWPLKHHAIVNDANGIARIDAQLEWNTRTLAISAVHPMPPLSPHWAAERDQTLLTVAQQHNTHAQAALIAGDFNATPWSSAFAPLQALGWLRATGLRPSWPTVGQGIMGIPIDHVLASPHWQLQHQSLGPDLGSDHRPVLVKLSLTPP